MGTRVDTCASTCAGMCVACCISHICVHVQSPMLEPERCVTHAQCVSTQPCLRTRPSKERSTRMSTHSDVVPCPLQRLPGARGPCPSSLPPTSSSQPPSRRLRRADSSPTPATVPHMCLEMRLDMRLDMRR